MHVLDRRILAGRLCCLGFIVVVFSFSARAQTAPVPPAGRPPRAGQPAAVDAPVTTKIVAVYRDLGHSSSSISSAPVSSPVVTRSTAPVVAPVHPPVVVSKQLAPPADAPAVGGDVEILGRH